METSANVDGAGGVSGSYKSSEKLSEFKDLNRAEALAPAKDTEDKEEDMNDVLNEIEQETQIQPEQDQQVHHELQNGIIIQANIHYQPGQTGIHY